jgi:hypothetical protein
MSREKLSASCAKCRGATDGNEAPQALWVFSSDACGTYGLENISIVSAVRSGVTGVIVFTSDRAISRFQAEQGCSYESTKIAIRFLAAAIERYGF